MSKPYEATGYDKRTGRKKTIAVTASTHKEAKSKAHDYLTRPKVRRV